MVASALSAAGVAVTGVGAWGGALPHYMRGLLGRATTGGPGVHAAASGNGTTVEVFGPPADAARGADAVRAALVPMSVIRVRDVWGHLMDSDAFENETKLVGMALGRGGGGRAALQASTGASLHASRDGLVIFVHGSKAQAAAACVALHAAVTPTVVLNARAEWGSLIGGARYAGVRACFDAVVGPLGEHTKQMAKDFGVAVRVSRRSGLVFIWGQPEAVEKARARIDELVRRPAPMANVVG